MIMDKQMIEEMAKVISGIEILDLRPDTASANEVEAGIEAEHLYNAGYRKIPEGAVVLTKEEYSDYLVMKDAHQNTIERCEKLQADNERLYKNIGKFKGIVRKETAEKFAERVKMAFYYHFDELIPSIMADKIDEICKEIMEGGNGL